MEIIGGRYVRAELTEVCGLRQKSTTNGTIRAVIKHGHIEYSTSKAPRSKQSDQTMV